MVSVQYALSSTRRTVFGADCFLMGKVIGPPTIAGEPPKGKRPFSKRVYPSILIALQLRCIAPRQPRQVEQPAPVSPVEPLSRDFADDQVAFLRSQEAGSGPRRPTRASFSASALLVRRGLPWRS